MPYSLVQLNLDAFTLPHEAEIVVETWRKYYNSERPHSSLGYQTPDEFASTWRLRYGTLDKSRQQPLSLLGPGCVGLQEQSHAGGQTYGYI